MKDKSTKTAKMHTWFGADAVVEIGPGFMHKAGLGQVVIPHPPLFNWLLRFGLPVEARQTLSLCHEFGHLQSAPVALLYAIVMVVLSFIVGDGSLREIFIVLLGAHGAWEMMAEIFTISSPGALYAKFYQGVSALPRILFWLITAALTSSGWLAVIR